MTPDIKRLETIYESKTETVHSTYACPTCHDHPLMIRKITTYSNNKKSEKDVCYKCHRGFKIKEVTP